MKRERQAVPLLQGSTSLSLLPLGSKNGGRRVRPAWQAKCCLRWLADWSPSSQSRPPSGRHGTRAHPEQPARPGPARGPRTFAAAVPSKEGAACSAPSQVRQAARRGRILSSPRQQRATCRKDQKRSGLSKKNRTIRDGKCVLAPPRCRSWLCGGVGGRKPCSFRSVCPLPLISVRPVLCMWGVTGSLVQSVCDTSTAENPNTFFYKCT